MTRARGTILDFRQNGVKGEAILSLALANCEAQEIADLKGNDLAVEIKPYRPKRSLDANAFCWAICADIAKVTGFDKEDIYRENIRQGNEFTQLVIREDALDEFRRVWASNGIGWFCDVVDSAGDGQKLVMAYHGSSGYDTKQMSSLIDRLLEDARNCEVTIDRNGLDALIKDWETKYEKRTARKR